MKRLNQTESPIFVILCVLCLQRQSFLVLFYAKVHDSQKRRDIPSSFMSDLHNIFAIYKEIWHLRMYCLVLFNICHYNKYYQNIPNGLSGMLISIFSQVFLGEAFCNNL